MSTPFPFDLQLEKAERTMRAFLFDWAERNIEDLGTHIISPGETVWVWPDGSFAVGRSLIIEYASHLRTHGFPVGIAPAKHYREPRRLADALLAGIKAVSGVQVMRAMQATRT